VLVPRFARLAFRVHLSSPSLLLAQQRARQVLTDYAIITSRNKWFAAQWRLNEDCSMPKPTLERLHAVAVGVLLCVALIFFVVKRVFGTDLAILIGGILSAVSVLILLLGYRAAKTPREIPSFGDPTMDEEIDRVLRERGSRTEPRC
jgi:Flp pilus assembly protein TadB